MSSPGNDELLAITVDRALRWGNFVLSSGNTANYYFDGKQVTLTSDGLCLVGEAMLARCLEVGATAIGGPVIGADAIVGAVLVLAGKSGKRLDGFLVRKETKAHGTRRMIEGPDLNEQSRVILVDDVLTTGGSMLEAVEAVRTTGATIIEAATLVDREEGGRESLAKAGIPIFALMTKSQFPVSAPA
jgi:orotate phosphoribosyltransferase